MKDIILDITKLPPNFNVTAFNKIWEANFSATIKKTDDVKQD